MTIAADHRPRVNAERRAKMRKRLIEAAILVFAEKGLESSQIDDVMKAAGVSRGGFYGHFRSMPELLTAIGMDLGNETLFMIEERVASIKDPAERIAHGMLLYLSWARSYPQFARFISVAGTSLNSPHTLVYSYLPPHVAEGNKNGKLSVADVGAAVDLLAGAILAAVSRIASTPTSWAYCTQIVAGVLLSLGVTKAKATKLSQMDIAPVKAAADSLLMRTHNRYVSEGTQHADTAA